MVTSIWGIVMLLLLGAAYKLRSPALYLDTSIDVENPEEYMDQKTVFAAFDEAGKNCFIAAGLYAAVLLFSLWQIRVNNAPSLRQYVMH